MVEYITIMIIKPYPQHYSRCLSSSPGPNLTASAACAEKRIHPRRCILIAGIVSNVLQTVSIVLRMDAATQQYANVPFVRGVHIDNVKIATVTQCGCVKSAVGRTRTARDAVMTIYAHLPALVVISRSLFLFINKLVL